MSTFEFDSDEGIRITVDLDPRDNTLVFTVVNLDGESTSISLPHNESIQFQRFIMAPLPEIKQ